MGQHGLGSAREYVRYLALWPLSPARHIRNIIINSMAQGGTEGLNTLLATDLAEFSSFDRMPIDGMDLIRALFVGIACIC